ncbi:DNA double-strand break repair RAD50 ATPase [Perilla frutescens var. hirtella]|uniref:DNA double-strand break repair RAD50 ATPase n=1 Tax=Perilla frutescens var. hirtella TaxID=608512 RepID=A0AAD4IT20_PERFH|nr:DNA double-strand break repair RAD50 ATPase [Perilla frutescens var. hirtella]
MAAIDQELISREDIETAMAKAVELRALHASLMQGKFPSSSPLSRHASYFSAQDYPVFTPSYEDEPLTAYGQTLLEIPQNWKEYNLDARNNDETILSDYRTANASSRKGLPSELGRAEDENSVVGSCSNNVARLRASPGPDYSKSRRTSLGDLESVSSCNKWKPANDPDGLMKSSRKSNIVVPLTDSHSSHHPNPRNKGLSLSWLFPKLKKKSYSPVRSQPEEVSEMLNELGMVSIERLKRELMEAHESRDAALVEAAEMKKSLGELSQKLEYLEGYCEEMKKALRQAVQVKTSLSSEKLVKGEKHGNTESSMPVSREVMVEGFLQMVSEARLSVKQFCKTLVAQIEETDHTLLDNLNTMLQPYKLSMNSKYSKVVLFHLEAVINQSLYQDFENCVFQRNGTAKVLDRQQECQARFQLFVALRNLSWNEVLRKGTKYYSDEFSRFCDQKMSGIIVALGWTRPWPEQLLQAFFVAAKCIWLLHLLAFSFSPGLSILRVEENKAFEARFMEDVLASKQRGKGGPSRVKIMVMPGFYVHDQVIRCKVLCTYKSVV